MEILGFIAAIMTASSMLPQLIKSIKTKQTKDISLWFLLLAMVGSFLWLIYYSIHLMSYPMMLTNFLYLGFSSPILIMKLKER